jgi:hypothetical protein
MRYVLDTQVVSYVLQARREDEFSAASGTVQCVIVDEVRQELADDPTRGALFQRWLATSRIEVTAIVVGSPA